MIGMIGSNGEVIGGVVGTGVRALIGGKKRHWKTKQSNESGKCSRKLRPTAGNCSARRRRSNANRSCKKPSGVRRESRRRKNVRNQMIGMIGSNGEVIGGVVGTGVRALIGGKKRHWKTKQSNESGKCSRKLRPFCLFEFLSATLGRTTSAAFTSQKQFVSCSPEHMDPTAFLGDGLVQKQREEELQEAKWRVKGEQKERERQAPEDKKLSNLKVPEDKKLSNLEARACVDTGSSVVDKATL
ncbi:unnamed protein product [Durusdinium trenchii]|uniref:Uncharacterized protein n=1 Tax=Durusdinium trenchii TaxID=1381693 RepID=A0ABP0HLF4_9DINO